MSHRSTTFRIACWVWRYARRRLYQLLAVTVLQAATVLIAVLKPWPTVFLIDYVLKSMPMPTWIEPWVRWFEPDLDRSSLVNWVIALTILLFLLEWMAGLAARYANVTLTQSMSHEAAAELFQKLQGLSLRFHTTRTTGDVVKRVTADVGSIAVLFRDALIPAATSLTTLIVMFIIMWRIDSNLTVVALFAIPCMVSAFWLYAGPMMDTSYREQEAEGQLYDFVERTFSAIPAVQAFGREEINLEKFQGTTAGILQAAVSAVNVQLKFKVLIGLATAGGTAAIIWFGGLAVLQGNMSVGSVVLFLSYLAALYMPLQAIMYTGSTVQTAGGSAERVLEIMQREPEIVDRRGARPLRDVLGAIAFEGVDFEYEPGHPVLRNISFKAETGQTIALVGQSGAGKSTLASLVPRFYDPNKGRILIDGYDLRDVQLGSLRRHIAIVLQDPFLFPITIAENIAYGNPAASFAQIENAARAANAHDFISRLPNGYETRIGERGATLSGGERQRLSIARALLKDMPILILDEPTSSLDVSTEGLLLDAMQRLMRGRTTIIIMHSLRLVRSADLILLLKDGRILESGAHEHLMRQDGEYARYVAIQSRPGGVTLDTTGPMRLESRPENTSSEHVAVLQECRQR
jgi:ATP-binding cassette subfamily B protein